MHDFAELVAYVADATLTKLEEQQSRTIAELARGGSTIAVKGLQAIELQKAFISVGMFSVFEAAVQDALGGEFPFRSLRLLLERDGEHDLLMRFNWYAMAVNVLKHGRGKSYDQLLIEADKLPFQIKRREEAFFSEGDVAEISILVKADGAFVLGCANVIQEASRILRRSDFCI